MNPFHFNIHARLLAFPGAADCIASLHSFSTSKSPDSPTFPPAANDITTSRHCAPHAYLNIYNARNNVPHAHHDILLVIDYPELVPYYLPRFLLHRIA